MQENNIAIRPLEERDVGEIIEMSDVLGLSPWTRKDYLDELKRKDSFLIVASSQREIMGFLVARRVPGPVGGTFEAEIYNIGVRTDLQNSGIGRSLMSELVQSCRDNSVKDVWLEVRHRNKKAIDFYTRFGFSEVGIRHNFYQHPSDDAVTMHLTIVPKSN